MDIRKLKKYFVKIIMIILFSFFMIPPTSHAYTPAPADISTDTLTEMNRNLTEMEKNAEKIYKTYKITQKEDDIRKELCEGQYICKNNYFIEFRDDHLEYVEWCMERIRNIKEQVIMAENDSVYATEQWNYIQDEYEQTVGSYNYVDTCADILLNDYYKKVELNIKERKQKLENQTI